MTQGRQALRRRLRELARDVVDVGSPTWQLSRLLSHALEPVVCVDVGASHFPHRRWRLFLDSPRATWIAVEPNTQNMDYAERWAWPCQLRVVPIGLSRSGGPQTLHVTNVDTGSSLLPPVIPDTNAHRVADPAYFFPVREVAIDTVRLSDLLAAEDPVAPVCVKLDTQGTELDILKGLNWDAEGQRVVGIEMEATLLVEPFMKGAGKFWEACAFLEDRGFELLDVNPIYGPSRHQRRRRHGRTFLNECDAVFSMRLDRASACSPSYRAALLTFCLCYGFYEEALGRLARDDVLADWLRDRGCDALALRAELTALASGSGRLKRSLVVGLRRRLSRPIASG